MPDAKKAKHTFKCDVCNKVMLKRDYKRHVKDTKLHKLNLELSELKKKK